MKPFYAVAFLAVALLSASPARAESQDVTYQPFAYDPTAPWRRGEHPGPLQDDFYAMEFTNTSMPRQKLSSCSITVEGPPSNYYVNFTKMQHTSGRICAMNDYVGPLLMVVGSKQIVKCADSTQPPPSNPLVIVTYSYDFSCPSPLAVAATPRPEP